ncbi:MAG TPA: hypothetical protein V6C78_34555 [Crinalium sp.]|jgi:hypothetical protein
MRSSLHCASTVRLAKWAIAPSLLGIFSTLLLAPSAMADPGLEGSYFGVAVDANEANQGLQELLQSGDPNAWLLNQTLGQSASQSGTSSPAANTASQLTSRQLQGRLDLPNSRISIRGAVDLGEQRRAVTPMFSYDFPVGDRANVYAGAGYTFVEKQGTAALGGDRNGLVLNAGAEAAVGQEFVIYGNVRFRPDTQRALDGSPLRVQVGIGHRF